ncbi:MAG: hypothetical protein IKZ49_01955 [Alphaproteobacteria bacterium]|nr:hypothetical protein [Alphaproteobacteria bacterium]
MKRIFLSFFLVVFCTANAFAASDVNISRVIPTKNTENATNTNVSNNDSDNNSVVARTGRRVNKNTNSENKTISRTISRSVAKGTDNNVAKTKTNTSVISRSPKTQKSERETLEATIKTVGRNARVSAASINNTAAVRRAGVVLRASTAEVGGRATIGNTGIQTGSNIDEQVRSVHNRAGIFGGSVAKKQITPTAESIAEAKDILEKTADLNSTCQAQYNECMDQFCAVVDANQKRCSCSANLSRYAKAQKAVEDANLELNDVAQRIRYVGLSADEIRAIMSETEAEQAMTKTRDNTKTRSMLEDIADMIENPTSSASAFLNSSGSGTSLLDMDMDFSSDSMSLDTDLFGGSKSTDISNKRGKDLYNEATKRCKSILTACEDAGGTASQISGNYDLAIDKDCAAYEQGLEKLNKTLVSNVRSANLMLQKARLSVLQNQNEYDIKECVGALEHCMVDDMVCGDNYLKCVDPTKQYIDENGKVVLGRNIAAITGLMVNYNNANINMEFLKSAEQDKDCPNQDGACIVGYLLSKIGMGATVKDGGLCRAVLDRCRDYTYKQTGKKANYNPYNEVVLNYIQRAMVNIKAAQSSIISEYASSCMADISACYNQQVNQINSWTSSASVENIYSVMTGACYNVALTCGYAVFAYDLEIGNKVTKIKSDCFPNNVRQNTDACKDDAIDKRQKLVLIQGISNLFYQNLLCPENSSFDSSEASSSSSRPSSNRTIEGYVNDRCKCNSGYSVWNGACVVSCTGSDQYRDSYGMCKECENGNGYGGSTGSTENNSCGS